MYRFQSLLDRKVVGIDVMFDSLRSCYDKTFLGPVTLDSHVICYSDNDFLFRVHHIHSVMKQTPCLFLPIGCWVIILWDCHHRSHVRVLILRQEVTVLIIIPVMWLKWVVEFGLERVTLISFGV